MMRNVSFGIFIFGMVAVNHAVRVVSFDHVLAAVVCVVASRLALRQTARYYHWFFKEVFRAALLYGKSLPEVIHKLRGETKPAPTKSRK